MQNVRIWRISEKTQHPERNADQEGGHDGVCTVTTAKFRTWASGDTWNIPNAISNNAVITRPQLLTRNVEAPPPRRTLSMRAPIICCNGDLEATSIVALTCVEFLAIRHPLGL